MYSEHWRHLQSQNNLNYSEMPNTLGVIPAKGNLVHSQRKTSRKTSKRNIMDQLENNYNTNQVQESDNRINFELIGNSPKNYDARNKHNQDQNTNGNSLLGHSFRSRKGANIDTSLINYGRMNQKCMNFNNSMMSNNFNTSNIYNQKGNSPAQLNITSLGESHSKSNQFMHSFRLPSK